MSDRIKLQITEVSEPKEVGQKGARKITFKAKDAQGKELPYFTFRTSLFDTIKIGTKIDAEVEVKTREYEGNTYTDRQVNQIFIDGQPAGGQRNQWQPRGESPEQRISIEQQVAAKIIAELRIAEKILENSPEYKAMLAWCRVKLSAKAESKIIKPDIAKAEKDIEELFPEPPPETPKSTVSASKKETGSIPPEEAGQPEKTGRDLATIKTIGDLRKALLDDFNIKAGQQLKELNLNYWTELAISPAEAYQQIAASR